VREIHGDAVLAGLTVEDKRAGERRDLDVGGLFIFIGADPCTEMALPSSSPFARLLIVYAKVPM
jgi:thioredoxin reductase